MAPLARRSARAPPAKPAVKEAPTAALTNGAGETFALPSSAHTINPFAGAKRARITPTEAPTVNGTAAKPAQSEVGKSIAS